MQFFRDGSVEAVESDMLRVRQDRRSIPSVLYEKELLSALSRFRSIQRDLGIEPSLIVMPSTQGVHEYTIRSRFSTLEK